MTGTVCRPACRGELPPADILDADRRGLAEGLRYPFDTGVPLLVHHYGKRIRPEI